MKETLPFSSATAPNSPKAAVLKAALLLPAKRSEKAARARVSQEKCLRGRHEIYEHSKGHDLRGAWL